MGIAIQLSEAPERDPAVTSYREGFKRYVTQVLGPDTKVLLAEIHPLRRAELELLWADQRITLISPHRVCPQAERDLQGYWDPLAGTHGPVTFTRATAVRYAPNSEIQELLVKEVGWQEWLVDLGLEPNIEVDLLAFDACEEFLDDELALGCEIMGASLISIGLTNLTAASRKHVEEQFRLCGYRKAGRLWGEAGSSQAYSRKTTPLPSFAETRAQAKVRVGEAIRDGRVKRESWNRFLSFSSARSLRNRLSPSIDLLIDSAPGFPLDPLPRIEVTELARRIEEATQFSTLTPSPVEVSPLVLSNECFQAHGIRPISFSYPIVEAVPTTVPRSSLAPIIPGYPYSFDDHSAYMDTYRKSLMGITHRKAGWDCFRHVEILAAGAIPLMLDAAEIPRYTMIHYPKHAMTEVMKLVVEQRLLPDEHVRQNFVHYFNQHLTSASMARYLLESSGLTDAQRILFVDENLPHTADYQSVLTLIGLKQLLGRDCHVAFPVDWIYQDSTFDSSSLYGRGFGYTKILGPDFAQRKSTRCLPVSILRWQIPLMP